MSTEHTPDASPEQPVAAKNNDNDSYVVIARRYRPQTFPEMVGQRHVTQALENAIATNRVGHAYLFTGARGVGKTSMARIFAKTLNCENGQSNEPCNTCDICLGISNGDDVDVLEIDGASNRNIDDIRRLRSNIAIRPSRGRYKIYIIDEVHMLTKESFNALLKTLEEPPEHVKFMFCTTNPEKILETILSRCQRFDFAPVKTASILERLQFIVAQEGLSVETEALQLLARRAQGSMRDGQSLLEQVLSFCQGNITLENIHSLLGTIETRQLAQLVQHAANGDSTKTLAILDQAIDEGLDLGQLAEQLLGYYRDIMAATAGCNANLMRHSSPEEYELLTQLGQQLGMETILAILQLLDETVARMRHTTQPRTLVEMALVRICCLEGLDELSQLIRQLQENPPVAAAPTQSIPKQNVTNTVKPTPPAPPAASTNPTAEPTSHIPEKKVIENSSEESETTAEKPPSMVLTDDSAEQIWRQTLQSLGDVTEELGTCYERVAISAPNRLVVSFKAGYTLQKESCERPERKSRLESALSEITGQTMRLDLELLSDDKETKPAAPTVKSRTQQIQEAQQQPFVRQALELFEAEILRVDSSKRSGDRS